MNNAGASGFNAPLGVANVHPVGLPPVVRWRQALRRTDGRRFNEPATAWSASPARIAGVFGTSIFGVTHSVGWTYWASTRRVNSTPNHALAAITVFEHPDSR